MVTKYHSFSCCLAVERAFWSCSFFVSLPKMVHFLSFWIRICPFISYHLTRTSNSIICLCASLSLQMFPSAAALRLSVPFGHAHFSFPYLPKKVHFLSLRIRIYPFFELSSHKGQLFPNLFVCLFVVASLCFSCCLAALRSDMPFVHGSNTRE